MLRFRGVLFGCMAAASLALAGCGGIQLPGKEYSAQDWQGLTHAQKLAQANAACAATKGETAFAATARRVSGTSMFNTYHENALAAAPCPYAAQLHREGSKN